jgi:hypothetical protein
VVSQVVQIPAVKVVTGAACSTPEPELTQDKPEIQTAILGLVLSQVQEAQAAATAILLPD